MSPKIVMFDEKKTCKKSAVMWEKNACFFLTSKVTKSTRLGKYDTWRGGDCHARTFWKQAVPHWLFFHPWVWYPQMWRGPFKNPMWTLKNLTWTFSRHQTYEVRIWCGMSTSAYWDLSTAKLDYPHQHIFISFENFNNVFWDVKLDIKLDVKLDVKLDIKLEVRKKLVNKKIKNKKHNYWSKKKVKKIYHFPLRKILMSKWRNCSIKS